MYMSTSQGICVLESCLGFTVPVTWKWGPLVSRHLETPELCCELGVCCPWGPKATHGSLFLNANVSLVFKILHTWHTEASLEQLSALTGHRCERLIWACLFPSGPCSHKCKASHLQTIKHDTQEIVSCDSLDLGSIVRSGLSSCCPQIATFWLPPSLNNQVCPCFLTQPPSACKSPSLFLLL